MRPHWTHNRAYNLHFPGQTWHFIRITRKSFQPDRNPLFFIILKFDQEWLSGSSKCLLHKKYLISDHSGSKFVIYNPPITIFQEYLFNSCCEMCFLQYMIYAFTHFCTLITRWIWFYFSSLLFSVKKVWQRCLRLYLSFYLRIYFLTVLSFLTATDFCRIFVIHPQLFLSVSTNAHILTKKCSKELSLHTDSSSW